MRSYAYDIIYGTMEENQHSDALFHRMADGRKEWSGQQKRFLKRLAYGTIERAVEMDAVIRKFSRHPVEKLEPAVRTVLRMAVYEIMYMESVPEAVSCNEAVELLKRKCGERFCGFVNGILRNVIRNRDSLVWKEDWIRYSLPKELMQQFTDRYGKKTAAKIGRAFLEHGGEVTIHVNTGRISTEQFCALLQEAGVMYRRGYYMPDAVIVSRVEELRSLPGYAEGLFFVQDESSMLPALCAGLKTGDTVVDVCAAPGGKTLHARQLLGEGGTWSVRDVSEEKVRLLRENMSRMGYSDIECKVWDGTVEDISWKERADVILADVPCSGIGIIGKKPEIKYHTWKLSEELVPIQRKICKAALTMLKKGGVFIYSTCTINQNENEENVQWLTQQCGLKTDSLDAFLPKILKNKMTARGMLQMLPGIHKSDGFFVARMIKE